MNLKNNELLKHKFICFVEDHYNPLNIIRSLGEMGCSPIVFLVGKNPCMINHSKYVGKLYEVETKEDGYNILLSKYGDEENRPFLFFCDDKTTSFFDCRFNELKYKFYLYNAMEQGRITWLQNKDNITNLGMEVGINCPKKEVVETGILPKTLRYPIITKVLASTMGAWKGDVYIAQNEAELTEAYKKIKSPQLILQEFVDKKGEFCIEGFSINDGKEIFIPYKIDYIRFYYNNYGHYMTVSPFEDDELKRKIHELLIRTRYNGIFELEFMIGKNNEIYFLEINFRSSTWSYAVTVGGGNLPYYWAKSTILGRIPYEEMLLIQEPFTAMQEPDDFAMNVWNSKTVKFSQWKNEVKGCKCHYFYNKNDKSPFYHYVFFRIINHFKKPFFLCD